MLASTNSLKRMAERKLRRWGLTPIVRGDSVFICQEVQILLPLGDFFSIFDLQQEIMVLNPNQPVTAVLDNRIKRFTNPFEKYQAHIDGVKNKNKSKREDTAGELEEILHHVDKIQVQVQ